MIKKICLTSAILMFGLSSFAQVVSSDPMQNLDPLEKVEESQSIADIVSLHEELYSQNDQTEHNANVWRRRSFFSIAKTSSTLTFEEKLAHEPLSQTNKFNEFKNDWGVAILSGTHYKLHKPIANIVAIGLNCSWVDLNVNHYKEKEGFKYDHSSGDYKEYQFDGDTYYTRPWGSEMYEASFGMAIGPSITIAPFMPVSSRGVHFFKLNAYYNIGYNASVLYSKFDDNYTETYQYQDWDPNTNTLIDKEDSYERQTSRNYLDYGHGMYSKFGVNISWKTIGFGFETRTGVNKYTAIDTSDFSEDTYKMKHKYNRIYLQLRF